MIVDAGVTDANGAGGNEPPQCARDRSKMIEAFFGGGAPLALWQQLIQLWELIVMVCRFLWGLLKLLGGGG
jgi:hypothetical protein